MFDSQATASWTAWEVLVAGVRGAKSVDNERVCNYLRANPVEHDVHRQVRFTAATNNFSAARNLVKQIQNKRWVVVWPPRAPGREAPGPEVERNPTRGAALSGRLPSSPASSTALMPS